jgi:hypothetical protein
LRCNAVGSLPTHHPLFPEDNMKKSEVNTYKPSRMTRNNGIETRPGAALTKGEPPMYWEPWVDDAGNVVRLAMGNSQGDSRPTAYGHQIAAERRRLGWLPVAEIADEDFERIVSERRAKCTAKSAQWDELNKDKTEAIIEKMADLIGNNKRGQRGAQ